MIADWVGSGHGNVIVSILHPAEALVAPGSSSRVVDATGSVAGFSESSSLKEVERKIVDECRSIKSRHDLLSTVNLIE